MASLQESSYFGSASESAFSQRPIRRICLCGNCHIHGIASNDSILREFNFLQNYDYFTFNCEEIYPHIEAIFVVENQMYRSAIQSFSRMLVRELTAFSEEEVYNGIGQYLTLNHSENLYGDMNIFRELIYIKLKSEQQNRPSRSVVENDDQKYDSDNIPSDIPSLIPNMPYVPEVAPAAGAADASAIIQPIQNGLINYQNIMLRLLQIYGQQDQNQAQPLEAYGSFLDDKVLKTLSKEELEKKNPRMLFSQVTDEIKQLNNSACAICQEDFVDSTAATSTATASATEVGDVEVRQLMCGHLFHTECVDKWLTKHDFHCPCCRKSCGNHKCNV